MNKYDNIVAKLKKFHRKFYINELLKGLILFFSIGLLYFLVTVSLEYFFWMGQKARLALFWLFVGVELALFGRFIIYPLLKLLNISKGISKEEAARIIGKHFPEVDDKLLNILQLKRAGEGSTSELLAASIDQKAEELQPIPFQFAINFKSVLPYLRYAVIPVLIVLAIWASGKFNMFSDSYSRVVNYQQAYEPPAPFSFHILNTELQSEENKNFELSIATQGEIIPQDVKIHYDDESYLLKNEKNGKFSYTFDRVDKNKKFYLTANTVRSLEYELEVIPVPKLLDFNMHLNYPSYLKKSNNTVKGTGNITVPEGTEVGWNLNTQSTDRVKLELPDTILNFSKQDNAFNLKQVFKRNTTYQIATSNTNLEDFEKLSYQIKVVRDQFPEIDVEMKRDTVQDDELYFHGSVSDDYGLSRLQLVFYPSKEENLKQRRSIQISHSNYDEFLYAFPDTLNLKQGVAYDLYFQVFDNDGVNGAKVTKSEVFSYRKLTDDEEEDRQLENQKESIQGMQKSLDQMKSTDEALEELDRMQKEKEFLNYNDRKKFEDYLKRIKQDNERMKNYTEKMKEDLDSFQKDKEDDAKDALKERLEKNEKRLEENEKLLEELEKYRDKIGEEEMGKRLEEMAKEKKAQNRSLEELLELTKRYYVQKKAEKLSEDLNKLSREQDELSDKEEDNTQNAQERLNKKFEDIRKALDDLQQENLELRKPMNLDRDEAKERSAEKDQQDATEKLEEAEQKENDGGEKGEKQDENKKQSKQEAKKNQKSAAEKMRQMSKGMQMQMQMGQQEQMEEDVAALRQILDNLIIFSFEQEDLMIDFEEMERNSPDFGNRLQHQQTLKENFKHVDDSLYGLALRNPMISEQITTKLIDIDFSIDKSLAELAKFKIRQGTSNQQYSLTGANDLANMLDNALQNMQMMMDAEGSGEGEGMPMPGEGSGEGKFQLPDIIEGQEELSDGLEEGMESGEGEENGEGEEGEDGESGEDGNDGEQGESGQDGENGGEGEGGSDGSQYGDGDMPSEEMNSAELYEIYKQQQKLRFQLEDLMQRENLGPDSERLLQEMEDVEVELLESGFSRKSLEMMTRMKQRMIRLQEASYQQEQEEKRQAETNFENYKNTKVDNLEKAKEYFQTIEILNRQSLPLQPDFKQRVQEYFKK